MMNEKEYSIIYTLTTTKGIVGTGRIFLNTNINPFYKDGYIEIEENIADNDNSIESCFITNIIELKS